MRRNRTTSRVGDKNLSPTFYAREVRSHLNLGWGPINPRHVCDALAIRYFEDDLGASGNEAGALVCTESGRLGIVVNRSILYAPRRRFTIAHELGHACIPTHSDLEKWCVAGDIEAFRSDRIIEREANEFAAEFLMPDRTVRERLKREPPSIDVFTRVADEFGTSLTSTACRVVSLADHDPCAVVLSSGGHVNWLVASRPFRRIVDPLGKGDTLSSETAAARVMAGEMFSNVIYVVPVEAWLRRWPSNMNTINEQVIQFPRFGSTLSFLDFSTIDDDWLDVD